MYVVDFEEIDRHLKRNGRREKAPKAGKRRSPANPSSDAKRNEIRARRTTNSTPLPTHIKVRRRETKKTRNRPFLAHFSDATKNRLLKHLVAPGP
jgi:hypothetical protein